MPAVAMSSLQSHAFPWFGPFSLILGLSILVLAALKLDPPNRPKQSGCPQNTTISNDTGAKTALMIWQCFCRSIREERSTHVAPCSTTQARAPCASVRIDPSTQPCRAGQYSGHARPLCRGAVIPPTGRTLHQRGPHRQTCQLRARQPRKPVATTNFSELSARDAGGFTLATLANRCFSSFCNSPSAPPAKTLDTNVPPSSSTSKAR